MNTWTYYESELLQTQFFLCLKDSIFGALALQAFFEMIRKAFGKNYRAQEIDFQLGEAPVSFENRVLLDVLDRQQAAREQSIRQQPSGDGE